MHAKENETPITNHTVDASGIDPYRHRRRALTHATPSITDSITDALVMKNDNIFFLSQPNGDVPLAGNHAVLPPPPSPE
jgi:hypothetical protein